MTRSPSPDYPSDYPSVPPAANVVRPAASASSWGRAPAPPASLTSAAHQWLSCVPPRYQPLATARRYPHIVNRLAAVWDAPQELSLYLQDLLLPSRPGRSGFSFDVLTELSDLQDLIGQRPTRS